MTLSRRVYRASAFKRAVAGVMRLYRRLLVLRGRDQSQLSDACATVVLAPHPDDETLGCGATIRRKRNQGTPVRIVIVTDGGGSHQSAVLSRSDLVAIRREEALRACALLGVGREDVLFLGYGDGTLEREADRLAADLAGIVADARPSEILTSSVIDGHDDHRALNRATHAALKMLGRRTPVFEYPVWFWDARSWVDRDAEPARQVVQLLTRPLAFVLRQRPRLVRTDTTLDDKRAAIHAYRSQMVNLTGEAGWPVIDPGFLDGFLLKEEIFFAADGSR